MSGNPADEARRAEAVRRAAAVINRIEDEPRISELVGRRLEELRHEVWLLAEAMSPDELAEDGEAILDGSFDWGPDIRRVVLLGVQPRLIRSHPVLAVELRDGPLIGPWQPEIHDGD